MIIFAFALFVFLLLLIYKYITKKSVFVRDIRVVVVCVMKFIKLLTF